MEELLTSHQVAKLLNVASYITPLGKRRKIKTSAYTRWAEQKNKPRKR